MCRYLRSSTEEAAKEAAALLSRKTKKFGSRPPASKHVKAQLPGAQSHEATSQSGSCHGHSAQGELSCLRGTPRQGFRV